MNNIRIAALLALSATVVVWNQQAAADPRGTAKVSVKDLDLSTENGVRAARERLLEASRRVCSQVAESSDLGRSQHYIACVDETLALAMRQISTNAVVARR
jgi:UrcA family protein